MMYSDERMPVGEPGKENIAMPHGLRYMTVIDGPLSYFFRNPYLRDFEMFYQYLMISANEHRTRVVGEADLDYNITFVS